MRVVYSVSHTRSEILADVSPRCKVGHRVSLDDVVNIGYIDLQYSCSELEELVEELFLSFVASNLLLFV